MPGDADLVLLPGSKSTIAALKALRAAGFDTDVAAHVRRGGRVHGICGGYQMLGRVIADPDGIEGAPETIDGLGLLDVDTVLGAAKTLRAVSGVSFDGAPLTGYEMHVGCTIARNGARPFAVLRDGAQDGAVSDDSRISGGYIHGLFAHDAQRSSWLRRLGGAASTIAFDAQIDATLDMLAQHLDRHLAIDAVLEIAECGRST